MHGHIHLYSHQYIHYYGNDKYRAINNLADTKRHGHCETDIYMYANLHHDPDVYIHSNRHLYGDRHLYTNINVYL